MTVKIKENSWIARIAALKLQTSAVAIVFGKTIYLHNTKREDFLRDTCWVCHELKHVQQYQQYGFVGFLVRYLFESVKRGYYNNKFEVEARCSENDTRLLEIFTIHRSSGRMPE